MLTRHSSKAGRFYQIGEPVAEFAPGDFREIRRLVAEGTITPSITTLTKLISKKAMESPSYTAPKYSNRLEAASTGTRVHAIIENFFETGKIEAPNSVHEAKYLDCFRHFLDCADIESVMTEVAVFGAAAAPLTAHFGAFGYGGTLDLLCMLDGKLTLLDWKTGGNPSLQSAYPQTFAAASATDYLHPETNTLTPWEFEVEQLAVVHLTYEDGPILYVHDMQDVESSKYLGDLFTEAQGKFIHNLHRRSSEQKDQPQPQPQPRVLMPAW